MKCRSCGFGPGARTGEVHQYQVGTQQVPICDDCIRFDAEHGGTSPQRVGEDGDALYERRSVARR